MATDHWWLGTTTDPTVAANWSTAGSGGAPGVSVPGTGDEVEFDGGGNNPCTFVGNMTFLNLVIVVGYTAKLDLVTFNLTLDSGGSLTLDGGGEFDCGTGSHSITAGTLDNKDQTTFTYATSTFTLNGVCTIIGNNVSQFHNLVFASGSAVTIDSTTINWVAVQNTCTINGGVVLDAILAIRINGDFVINSGANFSGTSYLYMFQSTDTHGLITLDGSVTTPEIQVKSCVAGARLVVGRYASLVKILETGTSSLLLELDNGTYNFNGGLELENSGTGTVTLQNKTNVPTINVTDLTIDRNDGTIVIDDDGAAVDWTITGDVIDQRTGATGFIWNPGTGAGVTLSGVANQAIDFMDQDCGQLVINKSAGTVDIEAEACELGAVDMVDNLTFTNSTMTTSADDKNITGDVSFADAGNDIDLTGSGVWSITGALDLSNVGTWNGGVAIITATSGNAQTWDFDAETVGSVIVNKTANTRLILGSAVTMTTFIGTAGEFDPNGQTITITGNCSWAKGFELESGTSATTMNGCTWIVGGNFATNGQSLLATASWVLTVTGRAVVSGTGLIEYSDASGGTTVLAYQGPAIDGGNNTNWLFVPDYQRSIDIDEIVLPIILGPRQGIII